MSLMSGKTIAFVYTTDIERALGFYQGGLGLTLADRDDYGALLQSGGAQLRLTVIGDHKAGEHPVAGWNVADIAATVRALKAKGVACIVYDGWGQDELGIATSPDGSKMAFFSDPDDNPLMLTQD
jgi:catechol 2,3-dioxygenase-like lactoylglutathione lyase family enzyme